MDEQERKYREDLVRIKRIKQGEETAVEEHYEPPSGNAREKAQNFFTYHWFKLLVAFIVLVLVGLFVRDIFLREKYDMTIFVAFAGDLYPDQMTLLEANLKKYAQDYDGNGEVNVKYNYLDFSLPGSTGSGNLAGQNLNISLQTRLLGELAANENFIFIFDDEIYEKYFSGQDGFADLKTIAPDAPTVERERFFLKDSKFASGMDFEKTPESLSMSIRTEIGISDIKNPKVKARYDRQMEFIKAILDDELKP